MRSDSRSHIEYLIPKNSIIVLDSYFNLTNKSNVSDRLQYDLVQFFDHLVVAYFLWATLYVDADVSMRSHVSKTVAAFAIQRQLRSIRRSVPRSVLQSLVSSLVL